METLPGTLVISLDFELMWGVRDHSDKIAEYRRNLVGARQVIPRMLDVLEDFEVASTWATVGFLFAVSRSELEEVAPTLRPSYADARLSPYADRIGVDESDDPLHFAPSLIERIRKSPKQEIATHTFSHFYCKEEGGTLEAFRADLRAAITIAERRGIEVRSIVFPRNQHNPAYDDVLLEMGITNFRGNPESYGWRFSDSADSRGSIKRFVRLVDSHWKVTGSGTTRWADVLQANGLSNVRASYPLRPWSPHLTCTSRLRLRRIIDSMRYAAKKREILHLWWHPHNFGVYQEENLAVLRKILEEYDHLRQDGSMVSLTMREVAERARRIGVIGREVDQIQRAAWL